MTSDNKSVMLRLIELRLKMYVVCQKVSQNIEGSRPEAVEVRKFEELGELHIFLQCFCCIFTF